MDELRFPNIEPIVVGRPKIEIGLFQYIVWSCILDISAARQWT